MRILATGASGFLGSHLVKAAQDRKYEVLGTCHRNRSNPSYLALDLDDSGAIGRALQDFKPDVLIHTAAQANTAFVERKPQLSHKVNVLTTENLARCCKEHSVAIIFISTSYVFSGKSVPPGGYTTSDPTDPTMTYGRQKVEAERRVLAAGPPGKTAVLRIPLLYSLDSNSPKHWLSELLGQLEQGETVLVDDCAQRRPSPVQDVCRVILDLCERYGQQEALPPILHFSCQIACTKLELLSKAAQKRGLPINIIQPFVHADDGVERPLIEHLSNATLEKIGIDVSCTAA